MGRKRKPESRPTEPSEPPQKQQQQEAAAKEELVVEDAEQENIEEVEEIQKEEEVEVEEEEEEEGEEEEEEEEEDDDDDEQEEEEEDVGDDNQRTTNTSISGAVANYDEDDEPVEKLLEPFGKEQLINLLCEASKNHCDIADRIRQIADEDPAHRKIFIHGLGWDTKAENLVEVFKQYGDIEDCKAVCDKISGKSKGYGFILFKSRRGARQALKEPQKKIGNRMTACQLASTGPVSAPPTQPNTTQQPQQQQQSTSEYTLKKIFVSNVGADLDPQKLHSFFSKFGEIEEGPLGLDKATGKPKGFCLFVYKTVDDARKALEEPHKNFEGNILHCQKAIDGPKPGKSQHQQHHHNVRNPHFQRNENAGFVGGAAAAGHGHLMAPSGNGVGSAATQALNPALGHALTALLATQGAGLGLNPALGHALLGTLGTATGAGAGVQGVYGNQTNVTPNMIGGYGSQGGYPNQQAGQGGSGRGGQHGLGGQYGGVPPYMGQ
ncbi:hypothetical protein Dsin_016757 [Dipteronia sinensis]|uniref:RRM domain-containing protein n=1 Tax=Dipteronia sinensis TaxID=43782 RepID=A0AAE0ADR9_9ROSI|nr:hypothetical protein Dsin_016757 [Dipteronia sinensis]